MISVLIYYSRDYSYAQNDSFLRVEDGTRDEHTPKASLNERKIWWLNYTIRTNRMVNRSKATIIYRNGLYTPTLATDRKYKNKFTSERIILAPELAPQSS